MKNSMNQPSQRQLRVAEQIKHVIGEMFARGDFHADDLRDAAFLTVTEVRISPDLKHATAYVIAQGGGDMDRIVPALNEEAFGFQKEISRQTQLKFTPKLFFKKDEIYDKTQRLDEIMANLKYSDQDNN